jgi:hypothetical protein
MRAPHSGLRALVRSLKETKVMPITTYDAVRCAGGLGAAPPSSVAADLPVQAGLRRGGGVVGAVARPRTSGAPIERRRAAALGAAIRGHAESS